jgi:hypothetical protein
VPVPPRTHLRRRYPFGQMQVGQFFIVEREDERLTLQGARTYQSRHEGWTYSADRDEEGRLRIFRAS